MGSVSSLGHSAGVRERIICAALELARTVGLESMSQAKVAARAGVRQSHLTYYFPTRLDLIKGMHEAIRAQLIVEGRDVVSAHVKGQGASLESLKSYIRLEATNHHRARMLLSLALAASQDETFNAQMRQFDLELVEHLRFMFREVGVELPAGYAELLHVYLFGSGARRALLGDDHVNDCTEDGLELMLALLQRASPHD